LKRFLVLLVVLATFLMAGCVGEVESYTDPGQTIEIGVNQQFVLALGSNPTTGYSWQESHDMAMVELVEKIYKEQAKQGVVGAGGVEYFRFKALKIGTTEITLVYKRPWEQEIIEEKVFAINIGASRIFR
jgi:inhibitor of cysteine peptidase